MVFGLNSRKYDLNIVRYYFVKTISDISDVNGVKKDNSFMFLLTPQFKFLDVRHYLAFGLGYDGWCKANGCTIETFLFLYEWLDDYDRLTHFRPIAYEKFYSKLKGGSTIACKEYDRFV